MRTDQQMMELILDTARQDPRILAAYLKGSRTNPNAPKDIYRDFDLVYVVTETAGFRDDPHWLDRFGTIVLMEEQDDDYAYGDRFGIRKDYDQSYSWLMLFDDHTRIDLGVETLEAFRKGRGRNRLFLPLLDKGDFLAGAQLPSDRDFFVRRPTAKNYRCCCTEFFWCLCDTAKGLARDEIPFAMTVYHGRVRVMLELMLSWQIGAQTDFSVSVGKECKYLKKFLSPHAYSLYLETLPDGDSQRFWRAMDRCRELFRETALETAEALGFAYPGEEEKAAADFLEWARRSAPGR